MRLTCAALRRRFRGTLSRWWGLALGDTGWYGLGNRQSRQRGVIASCPCTYRPMNGCTMTSAGGERGRLLIRHPSGKTYTSMYLPASLTRYLNPALRSGVVVYHLPLCAVTTKAKQTSLIQQHSASRATKVHLSSRLHTARGGKAATEWFSGAGGRLLLSLTEQPRVSATRQTNRQLGDSATTQQYA